MRRSKAHERWVSCLTTLLLAGFAPACAETEPELVLDAGSSDSGDESTSGEASTEAEPGVSDDSTGGDGDGDDDSESTGSSQLGCSGVDFLFVLDNSMVTTEHLDKLAEVVPAWIESVDTYLTDYAGLSDPSYHLMVVDTDATTAPDQEMGCDGTLGAGRRYSAAGQDCGLAPDPGVVTGNASAVSDSFACLGAVGTDGDSGPRSMQALLDAVGPQLTTPDGCNQGFGREDALLVVVLLTSSDDDHNLPNGGSMGEPEQWAQDLLAYKGGAPEDLVFVALISDSSEEGGVCNGPDEQPPNALEAPRLREFVDEIPFSVRASICEADYANALSQATDLIGLVCTP